MNIVLVFPPFYLETMYNLPPLGLINLATTLEGSTHKVEIIDFILAIRQKRLKAGKDIYNDCVDWIVEKDPDVVGFSAQCTTYPAVIQISKRLKDRRQHAKIVIGGHNASFLDIETLNRYPFIDAVVRGEGEITFRELIDSYEVGNNGEKIPGVTFRRGKNIYRNTERDLIINLDDLSLPDYSFLPALSEYRDACEMPRSVATLEIGRGCPYRCVYCSESIMWRRMTRTFSVPRLINEMNNLHKNHGAECFLLSYDQFTAKRSFVESFCLEVIKNRMNHLPWYCISRLDSVDANLLDLMRRAGCESMCYGIDSGSSKTLSFIKKHIDPGLLYQRVLETSDQGIIPTLSFVIGFPEEGREDVDQTLRLALRAGILGNNNPLIQLPTVLPGTDLHIRYRDNLVRKVDTYFALGLEFYDGKRLESDEEIINSDSSIFSSFYNVECTGLPLEELNLIATYFPLIVRFYPKTFLLLSLEYSKSISELFIKLLSWLREELKRENLVLYPQDCYNHFKGFTSDIVRENGTPARKYLADILKYEYLSIEVGKFNYEERPFQIDLSRIREFKPAKSDRMIIERFDFHIPSIIIDFKKGIFDREYSVQETFLVFRQENGFLDISEINSFGKEFLDMCDGGKSFAYICAELYGRYGKDMNDKIFFDSCLETLQSLGDMGLLEPK